MIWDKLFWLWFTVTALFSLALVLEEASTSSILFSSMLVGLGIIKLGSERSGRPTVRRRLLKRLSG